MRFITILNKKIDLMAKDILLKITELKLIITEVY